MKRMDQTKQSSAGERRARWSASRQQAEVGSLYHSQEGGTHGVRQIPQLRRPGMKTEKQRLIERLKREELNQLRRERLRQVDK